MTTTTTTLAGTDVEVDAEGFFVHPDQWSEAMVPELDRPFGKRRRTRPFGAEDQQS